MFKPPEDRPWGEEPKLPRREFTPGPSHKGYPAVRDPAADGRQKSPLTLMGEGQQAYFRRKYGPAIINP